MKTVFEQQNNPDFITEHEIKKIMRLFFDERIQIPSGRPMMQKGIKNSKIIIIWKKYNYLHKRSIIPISRA